MALGIGVYSLFQGITQLLQMRIKGRVQPLCRQRQADDGPGKELLCLLIGGMFILLLPLEIIIFFFPAQVILRTITSSDSSMYFTWNQHINSDWQVLRGRTFDDPRVFHLKCF